MKGLGAKIREARGTNSQENVANILGVDRTTLAHYEIDRREPDLETLLKIADVAGVSLDWLAGRDSTSGIEQARIYHDSHWRQIVDLATANNLTPEKIITLVNAALALKA